MSNRCQSFVADRGLDSNKLRKQLFEADILPVIDTRNLWDEINLDPDQLDVPTRALDENVIDTMLVTLVTERRSVLQVSALKANPTDASPGL